MFGSYIGRTLLATKTMATLVYEMSVFYHYKISGLTVTIGVSVFD
jgi:hypothetical protein